MAQLEPPIGHVCLVGAGPGDPELITVRGLARVRAAEVLLFDALVAPELVDAAPPACERIHVGKRKGAHSATQGEIEALLVDRARRGLRVVRLKGGDPLLFGRGGEELDALDRAGVAWEIVPGVSAAQGAAAACGLPLTRRGEATAFTSVTAHDRAGRLVLDWELLLHARQNVAVYMGASHFEAIVEGLLTRGMDPQTPFAVVAKATWRDQVEVTATLGSIREAVGDRALPRPALLLIGVRGVGSHSLHRGWPVTARCASRAALDAWVESGAERGPGTSEPLGG